MEVRRPEFVPDPSLSREEMAAVQSEIAAAATFVDDLPFEPEQIAVDGTAKTDATQTQLVDERPRVAGVDQAFRGDEAISAAVVYRGNRVIERATATVETEIPYVPGLLSFREGGAILAALTELETDPDVVLVDGSGRIHFREAGLATHVGVALGVPTVGVAKSLLCGRPRESLDEPLSAGRRVAIEADSDVTAPDGTVVGYAVQTRQYESENRHINPLYVSPGHRISAETAADVVERSTAGYKLPEPTRLADRHADAVKRGDGA